MHLKQVYIVLGGFLARESHQNAVPAHANKNLVYLEIYVESWRITFTQYTMGSKATLALFDTGNLSNTLQTCYRCVIG